MHHRKSTTILATTLYCLAAGIATGVLGACALIMIVLLLTGVAAASPDLERVSHTAAPAAGPAKVSSPCYPSSSRAAPGRRASAPPATPRQFLHHPSPRRPGHIPLTAMLKSGPDRGGSPGPSHASLCRALATAALSRPGQVSPRLPPARAFFYGALFSGAGGASH